MDITVDHDVEAVMRDGTVLRADVRRPPAGTGPGPVLLARTPYGKDDPGVLARLGPAAAVRRGYVVVIQDTRGRFASDGDWEPLVNEYADGHDTVRWASRLPGADGRVALFGPSYLGHTQWAAATDRPPGLVALMPEFTWSDPRQGLVARDGVRETGLITQWTLGLGAEVLRRRGADARVTAELDAARVALDTPGAAGDRHPPVLRRLPVPGRPDGPALRGVSPADVPTFTVAGWYDAFLQGSLDNHLMARATGHPAALVVGPWTHADQPALVDGDRTLEELRLDWLDGVLGRTATGPEPLTLVFVTGADVWRRLERWPPPATEAAWFLRGSGALSPAPPGADEPPACFAHDPANPVPVRGGALLLTDAYPAGPFDQRAIEARPDVATWTGPPLTSPLEVAGRITAVLTAASDGPAAWVARLCDVHPDGTSINLADGVARSAGTGPQEVRVDLWSLAHVFRAGHRLRLQIAASAHPRWETTATPGERRVHHDPSHPSRLLLPVLN
ncbi:CocE/NonD family hydrolase [Streptomyces sp. NPDC002574]|uniref:CocE/NonD family hydrolase n=1 Tax=Streptomyces sp. NPDC002574 TaxID=3364652 RepID=UPI0036A654B0